MSSLSRLFIFLSATILLQLYAQNELREPIDLIDLLRLNESSKVDVLYSKKVYTVTSSASRPLLELDPAVNLSSLAFRMSIRASYATQGTLLAITNPTTDNVLFRIQFSQSLYDLYYMKVQITLPSSQSVTLNVNSFDSNTWSHFVLILTQHRIYLYDKTDCLSGDSESIPDIEWPTDLEDYSLFLATTGEDLASTMTNIDLSELYLYSGPQAYSQLCRPFNPVSPDPDPECATWGEGMSGSGEYDPDCIPASGSGETPDVETPTSSPGSSSEKGDPGVPGIAGPPGPKGEKGNTSVVTQIGPRGEKGYTGASGRDGATGARGEKGERGVYGEKGQKGVGVEWDKVEEEIEELIENSTLSVESSQPVCELVHACLTNESRVGEKGLKGDHGNRGQRGSKGEPGLRSSKGESGAVGAAGQSGMKGEQGDQGDSGPPGVRGEKGEQGLEGPSGKTIPGVKGERGERGVSGEVGVPGRDGTRGPIGSSGSIGPSGPPGVVPPNLLVAGRNGSNGEPGEKGVLGDPGIKGAEGSSGLNGRTGEIGAKGEQGPQGIDGKGYVGAKGEKGNPASMNLTDDYLRSAVGRMSDLLNLKGDQGQEGASGPKGDSGRQGFPGIPGPQGAKGEPSKTSNGTRVFHARSGQEMAAVNDPGSLVYRSDLGKMAFLSLDGWLEIRASVTPWVEIVDVGTTNVPQSGSYCGDEIVDDNEECDSTNFNELTCKLLRGDLYEGELRCTSHCTLDITDCQLSSIIIFGLSTPVSGRLEGVTGADNLCNQDSVTGYYKAYLYSFNRIPAALIPYRYHFLPVKNAHAETMYESWAEFLRDLLFNEAMADLLTSDRETVTSSCYWSGGRNNNCRNWNSQQSSDTGLSSINGADSYSHIPSTCNKKCSLICVLISF